MFYGPATNHCCPDLRKNKTTGLTPFMDCTPLRCQHVACRSSSILAVALTAILVGSLFGSAARGDVRSDISTVALTGMQAPGQDPGVTFGSLGIAPPISPTGQVVFTSQLSGGTNNYGVWTGSSPADTVLFAQIGQPAPGTSGLTFSSGDTSPPRNFNNEIAAVGFVAGPGVDSNNNEGIWIGQPAVSSLLMREGSPAPLPNGMRYGSETALYSNYTPALSDLGVVAFQTGLQDSGGNAISGTADFATQGTTIVPLAYTGGQAPGLPAGATITSLGSPAISSLNEIIFSATYHNPVGPISDGSIIYGSSTTFQPLPVTILAQSGEQAPNLAPGVIFQNVSFSSSASGTSIPMSALGGTIFYGTVTGPGITPGVNDQGVWSAVGVLIARMGDAAPDVPGATFTSFTDTGIANNLAGVLAQISGTVVTSDNNVGIWTGSAFHLHLAVRDGDVVPDGANAPLMISDLSHFAMNSEGNFVFTSGTGAATAILAESPGHVIVVARPGDLFEVAPGDFRTISTVQLLYGGEIGGGPTPIDKDNLIAFSATFTDGSAGIFTSLALGVPEPATWVLAVLALVAIAVCRGWQFVAR
jgi:hypothetical protein